MRFDALLYVRILKQLESGPSQVRQAELEGARGRRQ